MSSADPSTPALNLTRSFALLSAIIISILSAINGYVSHRFLVDRIVEREATISMEFIQSIADIEKPGRYFYFNEHRKQPESAWREFFNHVTQMPGVIRANVYGADQTVFWSDNEELVGKRLGPNEELQSALTGQLVHKLEEANKSHGLEKPEHALLPESVKHFVELYLPFYNESNEVIGVVELYKSPNALDQVIARSRVLAWGGALVAGLILFFSLYWLVRRANLLIEAQHRQIVEGEKLSALGEMAAAVAHSIRNPLAAIRSSAELALHANELGVYTDSAKDIMSESDRLEERVREMLTYAQTDGVEREQVEIAPNISAVIEGLKTNLVRHGVVATLEHSSHSCVVSGDGALLKQAFNNVLTNAIESMHQGGRLDVGTAYHDGKVQLRVVDTGDGIDEQELGNVFRPFYTSKVRGLGLGLPLARRIIERHGGKLVISSKVGRGTEVVIELPATAL
ncbi:MAG: HAMP domain-containing histidine kinase [Gammaproteobacteria bacterium]|nr:HAMP domain-containing histidine kinase [Gammaproteobacteria bacterium]